VCASAAPATGELYFPAPSNQEQRRIAERLRRRETVVVVQGPLGTGKTHTIANLITDMLAHGRRVLVTSHTARALEEVRDKLPVEMQDLCVSMAAEHGRGQRELEHSVQTLLDRLDRYDERQSRSERARLEKRLALRENEREPSAHRSSARRTATPAADRVNPVPVDEPDKSVRRRPGQVDLPRAAFERLRQEQALLRARLAERPAIAAVDRAALQAQQHDHELTRQRLSARLSELDRILDNAVVRPRRIRSAHPYPGCLFHVRDALTNERYFVTLAEAVDEASGYEAVTPDSAMGRALAEATTGSSVTFTTPAGKRTVHILSIRSELPRSTD
jgi:transcription elongation GreA/GreB family factor